MTKKSIPLRGGLLRNSLGFRRHGCAQLMENLYPDVRPKGHFNLDFDSLCLHRRNPFSHLAQSWPHRGSSQQGVRHDHDFLFSVVIYTSLRRGFRPLLYLMRRSASLGGLELRQHRLNLRALWLEPRGQHQQFAQLAGVFVHSKPRPIGGQLKQHAAWLPEIN